MTPHIRGLLRPGHELPSEHALTTWWIYGTPLRGSGAGSRGLSAGTPLTYPRHARLVALLVMRMLDVASVSIARPAVSATRHGHAVAAAVAGDAIEWFDFSVYAFLATIRVGRFNATWPRRHFASPPS